MPDTTKRINSPHKRNVKNHSESRLDQQNGISMTQKSCTTKGHTELKSVVYFIVDWANLCTLSGAVCSCVALVYISQEKYNLAAACITMSNILDCLDGAIARETSKRDPIIGDFGAELDTLVDLINAGVAPGFLLMKLGNLQPLPVAIAIFYILCICIRQAYITYYGLVENGKYYIGMNTEFPAAIIGIVTLSLPFITIQDYYRILIWLLPLFGILCATRWVKTCVYRNWLLRICVLYQLTVVVSNYFLEGVHIDLTESNWFYVTSALFLQGFLCYPCCLRHIELNF